MKYVSELRLILLGVLAPVLVLANGGGAHRNSHPASDAGESSYVLWDVVIQTVLNNFNFLAIIGSAVLIFLVGLLAYDLYRKDIWSLPHSVSFLIVGLVIAVVFVLFVLVVPSRQVPKKTYGPSDGPLHMKEFYTELNFRNAKRISDFVNTPVVKDIVRDPADLPPPINRDYSKEVNITLTAKEVVAPLTDKSFYYYWTYNGKVPGPILRVREGDTVKLTLKNHKSNTHKHSIDLHAVTGPGGGAGVLSDIKPGEQKTLKFKAMKEGFYVYHCASPNIPTHIANQMFGGIIVEPKGGMSEVDEEFALF
ncbi:MAG: multicopper oxidase domain-containing protein, partial [Flavobacteriales bacterium]